VAVGTARLQYGLYYLSPEIAWFNECHVRLVPTRRYKSLEADQASALADPSAHPGLCDKLEIAYGVAICPPEDLAPKSAITAKRCQLLRLTAAGSDCLPTVSRFFVIDIVSMSSDLAMNSSGLKRMGITL
jgi:hypothetical protein